MAYTLVSGQPTFRLHALDMQTLQDETGSPITVSASHTLANGSVYNFNPVYQRQHPALLESSGNIYAAFGGSCDFAPGNSRGWLLGWNATTQAALAANELTDTLSASTAPTPNGRISFCPRSGCRDTAWPLTRQGIFSSPRATLIRIQTPIQVRPISRKAWSRCRPPLRALLDLFTPANVFTLDQHDADYSAGGVLVLPTQPGPVPYLAVAAGKDVATDSSS